MIGLDDDQDVARHQALLEAFCGGWLVRLDRNEGRGFVTCKAVGGPLVGGDVDALVGNLNTPFR